MIAFTSINYGQLGKMMNMKMYLWRILPFILVLGAQCQSSSSLADDTKDNRQAESILEKSDRIRFPKDDFQVDIVIKTYKPEHTTETRQYRILSKGNENSLVMTTAPASERGQILLMKRRDLWLFIPNVSQAVRLPLSQRLTGMVANGDLARANFLGDYNPTLLRNEVVDGVDHYVLELNAVDRSVTYHRVIYWVKKSNHRPYKAEFYTVSGRLMKTAYYENFTQLGGELRPTRLVMTNALNEGEKSVLEYSDMKLKKLEDKIFTKGYLKKLQ